MYRSTSVVYIAYIFLVFAIAEISARKLTITYNEGCDIPECDNQNDTSNAINLAHVTAVGDSDTVHYLWSTIGGLTILLAVTDQNATLNINWTRFLREEDVSNSISFTIKPTYTMALVMSKLIEFNDTKNTADVSSPLNNVTNITPFNDIHWKNFNDTIDYITCSGTFQSFSEINSSLSIEMRAYNETGRESSLPHLQYTDNTTQFNFSLSNFPSHFKNPRYAVELLMVSEGLVSKHVEKSIDDEYTPAIFSIINLIVPASSGSQYGSFSQWKPVSYSKTTPSLNNAQQCHETKVTQYNETLPSRSLLRAFFDISKVKLSSLNVTFGTAKGDFYNTTNYISWTATIGYGDPPVESLSQLVIIIISAGLGVPVIICIGGGIYTCIRKWKMNKMKDLSRYPPVSSVN